MLAEGVRTFSPNLGDYPAVDRTPSVRHDGQQRDRPDSPSSSESDGPPLRRRHHAGFIVLPLLLALTLVSAVIGICDGERKGIFVSSVHFAERHAMRAMKLVEIIKAAEQVEVGRTTYVQLIDPINDSIAQRRSFHYCKSWHVRKNDCSAESVIPDWLTALAWQRQISVRFRRAIRVRRNWVDSNEAVLKFVKRGRMTTIYNGHSYFKRLAVFQWLKRVELDTYSRSLGINQLVMSVDRKIKSDRSVNDNRDQRGNAYIFLTTSLSSFPNIAAYIKAILAFLVSIGLACCGYLMCSYGRGMWVIYGFALCILAIVPMFYAVSTFVEIFP